MSKINWKLAPEGAEELVQFESHVTWRKGIKIWCMVQQDWRDYVSNFKAIATRPTQKTVADAVEAYPKWQEPHFMPTRENLEKIAKDAQGDFVEVEEGEKWTHKYVKDNCYIKVSEPDSEGFVVVLTETDGYMVCQPEDLMPIKPIKPTISRSDENALRAFAVWYENETDCESLLDEYLAKHEAIEG